MLPSIPPSAPFFPHKYPNVFYIDATNGLDTNDGTFENPFRTLTKANSSTSGSGTLWLISPGTYSDALTINAANLDICGFGARSGLINITGTLTFSSTSGSIRCSNFSHASLSLTTTRPVYFKDCNMSSGTITKTGSGYLVADSCDWGNTTSIAISAGVSSLFNTSNSFLTVSGTGTVSINSSPSCVAPIASGGYLDIVNSTVYASVAGGNAIVSYGQGVLSLATSRFFQPSGYMAKIMIEGASYSMRDCQYEQTDSSITAAYIGYTPAFGNMKLLSPQAINLASANTSNLGIDLDGNVVISPNTSVPIEARYTKTLSQSLNGGSQNLITFPDKDYDTHNAFNGTTFTCPRNGYLSIITNMRVASSSIEIAICIGKNNQQLNTAGICGVNLASGHIAPNSSFRVKAVIGDKFDIRIYAGSATSTSPSASGQCWVSFSLT